MIYGNLVPVATMIIAWFSIGENPGFYEILAGILIVTGAIFIQVVDVFNRGDDDEMRESEESRSFS